MLYRVGKAERSLPKNSSYLRCVTVCNRGTISGITILYEARPWRTLARNWRKLNENETPGSPGLNIPRLIEVEGGIEIRPRHGFPFFAGTGSTVIINAERNLHLARGDRRGNWRY